MAARPAFASQRTGRAWRLRLTRVMVSRPWRDGTPATSLAHHSRNMETHAACAQSCRIPGPVGGHARRPHPARRAPRGRSDLRPHRRAAEGRCLRQRHDLRARRRTRSHPGHAATAARDERAVRLRALCLPAPDRGAEDPAAALPRRREDPEDHRDLARRGELVARVVDARASAQQSDLRAAGCGVRFHRPGVARLAALHGGQSVGGRRDLLLACRRTARHARYRADAARARSRPA